MFGPSGFFQTVEDMEFPDSSNGLEIIYDSKSGFSVLYRGNKNGRFFVYKALKPEFRGNPFYEDLLRKDFNIGFKLSHTAICQYYALVSMPETGNCIVMEWIDGSSLEEILRKEKLPRDKAKKIICEICDALDYMHKKQIVHRDLKPENILITHNGSNAKIIDFGLSDSDSYSVYKAPAGTRIYASPELLSGGQTDGRSDIWSLGIIICEISGYYRHVADKCTKKEKEKRYQTAVEVKNAILSENKRRLGLMVSYFVLTLALTAGVLSLISVANDIVSTQQEKEIVQELHPAIQDKQFETHKNTDSTRQFKPGSHESKNQVIPEAGDHIVPDPKNTVNHTHRKTDTGTEETEKSAETERTTLDSGIIDQKSLENMLKEAAEQL